MRKIFDSEKDEVQMTLDLRRFRNMDRSNEKSVYVTMFMNIEGNFVMLKQ